MQTIANEIADRYRRIAATFTQRAREVPHDAWGSPAPCEGWVARDVVRHMVEWMPAFLAAAGGPALPEGPSVDDDPVGAWTTMSDGIQALLDDPAAIAREVNHPRAGSHALGNAVDMFFTGDVLVHTWDLARATGLDERLDPDEVRRMLSGIEPIDDVLRTSGHYGAKVEIPPGADDQTRLIAFTGRRP
ncbi:MAG TPA: TIGR03086 family metal-binding protein [Acidimicrobiales bacterium]|nr:TIGR03086 family metal-binding protein [Acidimicrobiales bacterium]